MTTSSQSFLLLPWLYATGRDYCSWSGSKESVQPWLELPALTLHSSDSPRKTSIGQSFSDGFADQGIDPVQRVDPATPLVQSVGELVDVALQVLRAEMVVDPVEAALQNRPDALDAVGVRHPVHELLGAVVHGAVEILGHAPIGGVLIGAERRSRNEDLPHHGLDLRHGRSRQDRRLDPSSPSPHPKDGGLAYRSPSRLDLLRLVLVRFLAADVGLVGLDDPGEEAAGSVVVPLPAGGPDPV